MSTRNLALLAILTTLAVAALYLFAFPLSPVADTLIMRDTHLIPDSGTWDYWYWVYSHPNHGPQYRPVAFFTYFWLMGKIFNANLWSFAFVTYGFFAWGAAELLLLMRRLGWGFWAMVAGLSVWVLHPTLSSLLDQSFAMKYQFTLAVLIHGLRVFREEKVSTRQWIVLALLALLTGLSQEGTIVYPFVWALWDWAWHRKLKKQNLIFFSYVVIYLICRTLFFEVPRTGFMEVSWKHLPVGMGFYLHVIFSPLVGSYSWGADYQGIWQNSWLVSSLICLCVGIWAAVKKDWLPLFIGLIAAALVSPFSVLINHIGYDRAYVGLLPAALFAGWVVQNWKRYRYIPTLIIGVALLNSFLSQRPSVNDYVARMRGLQRQITKFIEELKPQPDELVEIYFKSPDSEDEWMNFMLMAAELAHQAPKAHLLMVFQDKRSAPLNYLHYVRDGVKYRSRGYLDGETTIIAYDQFQVKHEFKLEQKSVRTVEHEVLAPGAKVSEWVQQ